MIVALLAVGATRGNEPRTPEERVESISKRLACPVCDGESVFESRQSSSISIRTEIRRSVGEGLLSDTEIITTIEQSFGADVLLVPRADGVDALVWALPVAAFVCAIVGLAFAFRRWKSANDAVPDADDRALVAAARQELGHEP